MSNTFAALSLLSTARPISNGILPKIAKGYKRTPTNPKTSRSWW